MRDIVLGLDRKVDQLSRDMADVKVVAGVIGSNVQTLMDHETRIRVLERFRYGFPTIAMLAVLVSIAALAYAVMSHHS